VGDGRTKVSNAYAWTRPSCCITTTLTRRLSPPDELNYLLSLLTPRRPFPHLYRHAIILGEHHIPFLSQSFLSFGITQEHILCLSLSPTVMFVLRKLITTGKSDEMCHLCVQEYTCARVRTYHGEYLFVPSCTSNGFHCGVKV
jgi:hypothetical protein